MTKIQILFDPDDEDSGWLLCLGFHADEKRSSIYILEAKTMNEICRVILAGFIPWSHHCSWTAKTFHEYEHQQYQQSDEEIQHRNRKSKL